MRFKVKPGVKGNKCCLLINADPVDQLIFMEALYDVQPDTFFMLATDGQEAIEMLEQCSLIPDCVFVELDMGGIDGFQVLRNLKKKTLLRSVPVIVHTTSRIRHSQTLRLLKLGAVALCYSPYHYYGVSYLLNLYFKNDIRTVLN